MRAIWERLEEGFIALLLAGMTLLTFTQVVLRYGFNTGFVWALEANTYLFGWLILFGISYCVRVHAHIGIDIVVKALPAATQRVVGLVAIGFCALYAGLMLYGAWNYIDRLMRLGITGEDILAPRWLLTIIMPVGFVLLLVRLLEQAFLILAGKAKGFELADEAAEVLHEQGLRAPGAEPERSGPPGAVATPRR
ncbi:MAG: Tripartite ATP-independent periplasmic transporter DctQ component [Geminicoccaceae bacterium]|nr:Tripartite ATP-independent periplasmic transporter DctQ component [Geminicoccaceae bacterium]